MIGIHNIGTKSNQQTPPIPKNPNTKNPQLAVVLSISSYNSSKGGNPHVWHNKQPFICFLKL